MGSGGGVEVKSSMEAMLDSLMRRDEKPRDVPPALPPRPPSRGRLPSAKRSLPPLRFGSSEENLVLDPSLLVENQADAFVVEEEKEKVEEEVRTMEIDEDVIAEKVNEKEEEEVDNDISRALKAEEEVAVLRQQLLRFETKCSDYEAQIKCLHDQLSKQQQQQQPVCIQVRRERGMNGHDYADPSQGNNRQQQQQRRQPSEDAKNNNPVGQLTSEFENKKRSFEEEARVLSQWRPNQPGNNPCSNPMEDLLKLKLQFTAWKREFKVRLQDTRGSLEKVVGKSRMNCWTGMKWKK